MRDSLASAAERSVVRDISSRQVVYLCTSISSTRSLPELASSAGGLRGRLGERWRELRYDCTDTESAVCPKVVLTDPYQVIPSSARWN